MCFVCDIPSGRGGTKGSRGVMGLPGRTGIQGAKGEMGPKGGVGPFGPAGIPGRLFVFVKNVVMLTLLDFVLFKNNRSETARRYLMVVECFLQSLLKLTLGSVS